MIKYRNQLAKYQMMLMKSHALSHFTIIIAESIPFVVSAIEPHRENAARLQILRKHLYRLLAVRRVVQYADAVDHIETSRLEGQAEDICLHGSEITICQVAGCNFCRSA